MKITTATLIAMLALGSTFTFAQTDTTAAAKADVSESYSITVTTVMRPLIPVAEAKSEGSTSEVNTSAAADTNASADANLKFSVTTSEVDRILLDSSAAATTR